MATADRERGRAPGMRERQRQLTRQLLLDAARQLFAEHGYAATTVDQIADAAGANRATLYLHFDGKEAVAQELSEAMWDSSRELFGRLGRLPSWSRPQLRAWLEANAERWPSYAALLASLREATVAGMDYRAHVEELVERMGGEGGARMDGEEARMRGRLFVLQVHGFYQQWCMWGWSADRDAHLDAMVEVCWTTLHRPGPARPDAAHAPSANSAR